MKIGIIGTRGIPNNYGGFEQLAEYLSVGLTKKGHQVFVYSPHNHIYQKSTWNNVNIIHKYDPEYKLGTAGQFIYDYNCILDSRKHKFDIILQLGYTSSSIWGSLMPTNTLVVTNMDGLEWKRAKFNSAVQKYVKFAEKLAIKFSNHFISDSVGIQKYLIEAYSRNSTFIPYGAHLFHNSDVNFLGEYSVKPFKYNMLIARLEPENSIEQILTGVLNSTTQHPFLVIGNHNTKYGNYLKEKYKDNKIWFVGSEFNIEKLNNLRFFSNLYFHGHTVGGTNPSLLEAMASNCLICAHDNVFNSSILGENAYYFTSPSEVATLLNTKKKDQEETYKIQLNRIKIESEFSWENIVLQYEKCFEELLNLKYK